MPYFGPYLHAVAVGPLDTVTTAAYSGFLYTFVVVNLALTYQYGVCIRTSYNN